VATFTANIVSGIALNAPFVKTSQLSALSLFRGSFETGQVQVVVSPEHHLAHLEHVHPADIAGEAFLATVPGCSYRVLFERALTEGHVQPAMILEFHSIEVIKQCVMSGMGVAVLPAIDVAGEAQSGRIAVLSWAGPELQVVTQMVRHKDKWLSPALQAFLMISRDVLVGSQTKN
jgi:DNA-binding transcriptional LysR family regulator